MEIRPAGREWVESAPPPGPHVIAARAWIALRRARNKRALKGVFGSRRNKLPTRPGRAYDRLGACPSPPKLSRELYDRFGNDGVNELVGLLNDMDMTFKAELRQLNDQNFERLERRIAELRAEMSDLKAELIKWMFLFWLGTVATMLGFGRFFLG
jgi:hypothetical protein